MVFNPLFTSTLSQYPPSPAFLQCVDMPRRSCNSKTEVVPYCVGYRARICSCVVRAGPPLPPCPVDSSQGQRFRERERRRPRTSDGGPAVLLDESRTHRRAMSEVPRNVSIGLQRWLCLLCNLQQTSASTLLPALRLCCKRLLLPRTADGTSLAGTYGGSEHSTRRVVGAIAT